MSSIGIQWRFWGYATWNWKISVFNVRLSSWFSVTGIHFPQKRSTEAFIHHSLWLKNVWVFLPVTLELERLELGPKHSEGRIQCLVTAFLRVFRIQEKANVFWLQTHEGGNTDYLLFSTKNTDGKRPFSNPYTAPVPSPKAPVWQSKQSQDN